MDFLWGGPKAKPRLDSVETPAVLSVGPWGFFARGTGSLRRTEGNHSNSTLKPAQLLSR